MPLDVNFQLGTEVLADIVLSAREEATYKQAVTLLGSGYNPWASSVKYWQGTALSQASTAVARGSNSFGVGGIKLEPFEFGTQMNGEYAPVIYSDMLMLQKGTTLLPSGIDLLKTSVKETIINITNNMDFDFYHGRGKNANWGALYSPATGESITAAAAPVGGTAWSDLTPSAIYNYFVELTSSIAGQYGLTKGPMDLVIPISYKGVFGKSNEFTMNGYGSAEDNLKAYGFNITYMAREIKNQKTGAREDRILLYDKASTFGYELTGPVQHGEMKYEGDNVYIPFASNHAGVNFRKPFLARYIPLPVAA